MSDVAELFRRDPLKLTTEDLNTIIASLRQARTQFTLAGKAEAKAKPAKQAKTPLGTLDLSALGL